ncbi:uncharacterized protein B4U80_01177 [Leptotrombidium deliense]|uniref:Uncharacterized protein n=1 Tax=Leptotrombidium deliense TaxID=299467 RepID=A0A443SVB4_9ACAR|nr:uncharacterized protein B4U80_01177 [Leptotrombidium deliense]
MWFTVTESKIPRLFGRHDYNMYSNDIVFEDNIRHLKTQGILAYRQSIMFLKIFLSIKYAAVGVSILKMTKHPEDSSIRVRWRISGSPGLVKLLCFWKYKFGGLKQDNTELSKKVNLESGKQMLCVRLLQESEYI